MFWIFLNPFEYEMRCAIWYHLYNFKNVKSTHGGVLLLVRLQAEPCNFSKSNTPQRTTYKNVPHISN